jgi:hypothetical protein
MNSFSDVKRKLGIRIYNKLKKEIACGNTKITGAYIYKLFPNISQDKWDYALTWVKHIASVSFKRNNKRLPSRPTIQERLYNYKCKQAKEYLIAQGLLGELSGRYAVDINLYKSSPEEIFIPRICAYSSTGMRYSTKCTYRKTDIQWEVKLPVDWKQRLKDLPKIKRDSLGERVIIIDKRKSPFKDIWYLSWVAKGRKTADVMTYHGVCIPYKRTYQLFSHFEGTLFDEILARLGIQQL